MDRIDEKRSDVMAALRDSRNWNQAHRLTVREIMTNAPFCVDSETNVLEMVQLLGERGHRHLLVTDDQNRLAGVVSDRDVGRCFGPGKYPDQEALRRITAGEIMSTEVLTTGPDEPLQSVVSLMVEQGISCLPVDSDQAVVGIVTDTDLRILLELILESLSNAPDEVNETAHVV